MWCALTFETVLRLASSTKFNLVAAVSLVFTARGQRTQPRDLEQDTVVVADDAGELTKHLDALEK